MLKANGYLFNQIRRKKTSMQELNVVQIDINLPKEKNLSRRKNTDLKQTAKR